MTPDGEESRAATLRDLGDARERARRRMDRVAARYQIQLADDEPRPRESRRRPVIHPPTVDRR
jgi:hypothetical protein